MSKDIYVLRQIRTPNYFDCMQINAKAKNLCLMWYQTMLCDLKSKLLDGSMFKSWSDAILKDGI